jgi:hypothetical protein
VANGTENTVWSWEILHWALDTLVLVIAGLGAIAWNTKPDRDEVTEMIEAAVSKLAADLLQARKDMMAAIDKQSEADRELFQSWLDTIRKGMEYNNRALDRIEANLGTKPRRGL